MKTNNAHLIVLGFVVLALSLLFGGCGELPDQTPTAGPEIHPTSTIVPGPTSPPPPGPTEPVPPDPTPVPGCTDQATFDSDVTIPDDTVLSPGQSFVKTWRLLNSGTCAWTSDYTLVFARGDDMGGPLSVSLPGTVPPDSTVDLSVSLVAPAGEGIYESRYLLRNAAGDLFGITDGTDGTFLVRIVVRTPDVPPTPTPIVPPTPTPIPPITDWRGEYYGNPYLTGAPMAVRNDVAIDFDWGHSAPISGMSPDNFSVRWTRTLTFEAGEYRFRALVDDGVRLWVDDVLVIDSWTDGALREVTGDYTLTAGDHVVRIEYYERTADASIQVSWGKPGTYPEWKGQYWANRNLSGDPALVRNDATIDFNWGSGAPASGLPADGFSARWTRTADLEEGTYRFHVIVDDGARLYVGGKLVLDAWYDGAAREVTADYGLLGGTYDLRVDFYEKTGGARVHVWWERVGPFYPDWKGEYWINPYLSGDPTLVQNEGLLDFDWGLGSCAAGMPVDNWSARWTREAEFDAATYRFHIVVDEGARMWVDGVLIIDTWRDGTVREVTADVTLTRGEHNLRVEYYERTGEAEMSLWWEKVPPPTYPDWQGEYWSNMEMAGNPILGRNDAAIDFNWGNGAPAPGLPADKFSVRWERWVNFAAGDYVFYAQADNGIRAYLDGVLIIDEWYSNGKDVYMVERTLSGVHHLVVEYYENGGAALARFWWRKIKAAIPPTLPVPTRSPIAPPTPLPPPYPDWEGAYWTNMELAGNPILVRNDVDIDFDWGDGAAAPGLPADKFSVRWEREINFEAGIYIFYAQADNGIRVYLDGNLLIDEWYSNGKDVYVVDLPLDGTHHLVVEYYENGGAALVKFWWSAVKASIGMPGQAKWK